MHTSTRTPTSRGTFAAAAALLALAPGLTAGDTLKKYGAGTAGSGNVVPRVWANATPRTGDANFRLEIDRALGGTYGIVFLATAPADATLGGVRFLIDASAAHLAGSFFINGNGIGDGRGSFGLPIPTSNSLLGQNYYAQMFTLDDFAPNPLGFGATEGLRITPTLPGQLIASRSRSGQPDPQTAIELASGRVADFDQGLFDEGTGFAYSRDGRLLFAAAPTTGKLHIYDAHSFPPQWRQNAAIRGTSTVRFVAVSPEGDRLYVVHNDRVGTSPEIEVLDARVGPTLGLPHALGNLRVEGIADARAILFGVAGGRAVLLSETGGDGSGAALIFIDADVRSPTYNTELSRVTFPGCIASAGSVAPDGSAVYVALSQTVGGLGELAIVDTVTLSVFDADLPAAGIQNLGGEISRSRTPLPRGMARLAGDPRGGTVFFASVGSLGRIQVEPTSPEFARIVTATGGIGFNEPVVALAITDAGERVYLATRASIVELDPATLTATRTWPVPDTLSLLVR